MASSVYLLQSLAACGGEMAGHTARWILQHTTKSGRLSRELQRLKHLGAITLHHEGALDQRIIRLTESGRIQAGGALDPEALWSRAWDGVWRIVAFDVPQSAGALRSRLRRQLHDHRFGWLQNSVWISPDPVTEFRVQLGESGIAPDSLTFFEARPAGGETAGALVQSAWDFARLRQSHASYLEMLRLHPGRRTGTAAAWMRWLEMQEKAWHQILRRDPFLPAVLLPQDYLGRTAWAARSSALKDFSAFANAS